MIIIFYMIWPTRAQRQGLVDDEALPVEIFAHRQPLPAALLMLQRVADGRVLELGEALLELVRALAAVETVDWWGMVWSGLIFVGGLI